MKITEKSLSSKNNYTLSFTLFEPETQKPAEATVLIAPAMAVLQRYYRKFSEYLCNKGYNVISFDYLGIGKSTIPLKDKTITYQDWGGNVNELLEWINLNLQTKIYYIAHSAGGQLLGLASSSANLVSKAYIISAGIGYWKNWSFPRNYYYLAAWYIIFPSIIKLYGYAPKWAMGERVPIGVIKQWLKWGRRKRFMLDDTTVQNYFSDFNFTIEFIMFADDNYSPPKNAQALASFYPAENLKKTLIHPKDYNFKKIGHFGFFRSKFESTLWPILNL